MAAPTKSTSQHRWSFYRAGGVDQVRLDKGADIFNLDQLDQKLWVALSCPVKGLEFDQRTLELLDTDKDAHVRPPEIIAAVQWLGTVLKSADDLVKGQDGVALASIRDDTAEGRAVLASAKHILAGLGKDQATAITIEDSLKTAEVFAKARLNGDGIVPPESVADAAGKQAAREIIDCCGGLPDRSGLIGFDRQRLDQFFAECAAYGGFRQQAEADARVVLPLGEATAAAVAALDAVRAKMDDYFGRCRLAAFDPRALAALNRQENAYLEVAAKDMTITADEVAHFPLAMIEADKPLPLVKGINPAWAAAVAKFRELCCKDKPALTEAEWSALCTRFAGYKAWVNSKAGSMVEKLGLPRVKELLAGNTRELLQQAIADDLAVAPEIDTITKVEKLARLHRDFARLLNNYVSFTDFYARRGAIFQAGTLYLDGRSCDLCFHVNDPGKHGTMAPMAKSFLAYVDLSRPSGEKMQVAAAFTAGDSDNLFTGRNGIFYDRKGRDWNATIARIVDNPISIGQAFWSPYKKVMRWVEESVAKRAAAADADATTRLKTAAELAGEAAKTGEAKAKPKFDVGVVAALGVAVGGITAAISSFVAAFFGLGPWIPLGGVGLVLAISGPSMLIAWLKLRQRNLGPILDANGWAVNTLTRVNIPLGGSLTSTAKLPEGAVRSLIDPYAPKKSPWPRIVLCLLLLAVALFGLYRFNFLHRLFPDWIPAYSSPLAAASDSAEIGGDFELTVPANVKVLFLASGDFYERVPVTGPVMKILVPAAVKAGSTLTISDLDGGSTQVHIKVIDKKK